MLEVFYFDGMVKKARNGSLSSFKGRKAWINLYKPAAQDLERLKALNIHSTTREDLGNQMQRSKIETFEKYIYLVVYTVDSAGNKIELDFVLGKNFLITSTFDDLPFVKNLADDSKRLGRLLKLGPDFLMHFMLDRSIDSYFPLLDDMDDRIDDLEEKIFSKKDVNVINEIFNLRREVLRLRRIVVPQQQKMGMLVLNRSKFISQRARLYIRDVYDHSVRITETVDNFRDLVESTQDTHASIASQKMSEVIKVLTIMSVTMLPLTLITGWYGMNFVELPGLKEPAGYWHVILVGIAIVGILMFYYKKKGWL